MSSRDRKAQPERAGADPVPEPNPYLRAQQGRLVLCPAQITYPPANRTAARAEIQARGDALRMQERYLCSVDNVGGARNQNLLDWCRICPNASYEVRWEVISEEKYVWADALMTQLNSLYREEWELVPFSRTVIDHRVHKRCIEIKYRFRFVGKKELPHAQAKELNALIEAAAPPDTLVTTTSRRGHDFCEWGWDVEGEAWLALYIQK